MKTKIVLWVLGGIGLTGCQWVQQPIPIENEPVSVSPQPPAVVQSGSQQLQYRFTEGSTNSTDAVQNAILWSEKYERLSETTDELRERNMHLFEENTKLKEEVKTLGSKLAQTQKELDEANEFLQKMHLELNQWKADVLGFREELRQAQAAQLQALGKILRILGAEPVEPAAGSSAQSQTP